MSSRGDPTKKDIPINPPNVPDSKTLWYTLNWQCSIGAGWSSGLPETNFIDEKTGKHQSEIKRMENANK